MTSIMTSHSRLGGRTSLIIAVVATAIAVTMMKAGPVTGAATLGADEELDGDLDDRIDTSDCYVVTIFGLKTADCSKQSSKNVPRTLDPDLQVMRFDENRVTLLDDSAFSSYANLQEIYLARNRIELVAPTALRGLYSLQILDLDGNLLSAIPSAALRLVGDSLRLLNLKGNPIRHIEADSLSGLVNLEEVNFENCWLSYVDPAAFRGLTRLVEINLVNNELQTLHPDMEDSFSATALRVLRLYRNPWTCNCRLRWLRRWITTGPATGIRSSSDYSSSSQYAGAGDHSSSSNSVNWDFASNTPTCAAPRLLRTVAWRHLTPDQFACPSRIVGLSGGVSTPTGNQSVPLSPVLSSPPSVAAGAAAEIKAVSGRNATIECIAAGDPEPTISWSRDPDVPLPPGLSVMVRHRGGEDAASVGGEPVVVGILTMVMVDDERDTGDYRCTADNPAGRAEVSFRLTIVDAGLPIIPSGRVSGTGNEGGGSIRRTITTSNKEGNDGNWTDVDRDVILGIIGGLLVLAGVVALFVTCRPRLGDCIRRQRDHMERRRHNDKSAAYRNDCAASKPLNNVSSIAMTSLSPASTNSIGGNRRNHRGNNHTDPSVVLGVDSQRNGMELRLFEPEEDEEDCDEEDDGGHGYQSSSPTITDVEHCSKRISSGCQRTSCSDFVDLVRIGNDDAEENIGTESSTTSSKCRPPPEVGVSCVNDDVSLSDQLSEVSCDRINQGGDLADPIKMAAGDVIAGDACGRHERGDRSNRTVSFGPDLVLDTDNSVISKWQMQNEGADVDGCDVRVHRRPNFVGAITPAPVSALKLGRPDKNSEFGSASASPMSLGETPSMSTSSSSNSTRSSSNPGHIAYDVDRRPVTTINHVGEARVLPVGRPCVMWPMSEDPRCRPLATGPPSTNRRHSGCNIDQQVRPVNGFAFSHHIGPAPTSVRRLSPATCGGSQLLAACASLERPSVRRRLPQPRMFAIDDRRDSFGNSNVDATLTSTLTSRQSVIGGGAASHLASGRHITSSTSTYSTCLPNKNESASATASYTLADILAPPFGAVPVNTGTRPSAGVGNDRTGTNRKYTMNVDMDDDESITTIL